MKRIFALLITILFATSSFAEVPAAYQKDALTVGIKQSPPFAIKQDGEWTGASIDLLESISTDLDRPIVYFEFNTVPELLEATKQKQVELSIGAMTITAERERDVDFSYPYFSTTLGVMVESSESAWALIGMMIAKVSGIVVAFVAVLYLVGFIMIRVDNSRNITSIHDGAWWALVTFTTVGYGDKVPEKFRGKVVAAVWMVISLFAISMFTGYISSSMTVERLSETPTTISDLHRTSVVTLTGTTGEKFLIEAGIQYSSVETNEEAFKLLKRGKVEAFVYDEVLLLEATKDIEYETYRVWPVGKQTEYYGIALPESSDLKEAVDISILQHTQN